MTNTLLVRPEVADKVAYCSQENCGAAMLYKFQQVPGDGTVVRSTKDLCSKCYDLSRNLNPFVPGCPPAYRRGQALLEDIPVLLDRGLDADSIARKLGYRHVKNTYRFLARHGRDDLLARLRAAKLRA